MIQLTPTFTSHRRRSAVGNRTPNASDRTVSTLALPEEFIFQPSETDTRTAQSSLTESSQYDHHKEQDEREVEVEEAEEDEEESLSSEHNESTSKASMQ